MKAATAAALESPPKTQPWRSLSTSGDGRKLHIGWGSEMSEVQTSKAAEHSGDMEAAREKFRAAADSRTGGNST